MSSTAATLSAEHRVIPLRMRGDLAAQPEYSGGEQNWNVKDPISLRYFQMREEEYWILRKLNGRATLKSIQREFERRFTPRRLTLSQIQHFLVMLHREGLVVSDTGSQTESLLTRHREHQRQRWTSLFLNVLAIRFRGVDPERFLEWLSPKCRWMFSRTAVGIAACLILSAVVLVCVQFDTVQRRLPDLQTFLTAHNLVLLALALSVAKMLHELGHGLTCKHFGGECHEIGFMLLAFTPCLYCNVSDAWMLSNKWHRMVVGASGVLVEMLLASMCAFLWWFSEPGLFNTLCLNIMFVCSVSTILFNGNPLLRYDGYYVLADFLETPNLRQQSTAMIQRSLTGWFCGIDPPQDRVFPQRHRALLVVYGLSSIVYRWFIICVILWFVHRILKPFGLAVLAELLAIVVIGGMILIPLWHAAAFVRDPVRSRQIQWKRLRLRGFFAGIVLVAGVCAPLPYRVSAPAVMQPLGAKDVYVSLPGRLVESVSAGTTVKQGETLATLDNLDLEMELERLKGQKAQLTRQVESLERRRVSNPDADALLPTTRERLSDVEQRLRRRLEERDRLTIVAPIDGTVIPPPTRESASTLNELDAWQGTPLDERNRGCFLETGTLLCHVGDPKRLEAVLIVDQASIEFVRVEQAVDIQMESRPGVTHHGKIMEIAEVDLDMTPRELAQHADLVTRVDRTGTARPAQTMFQARVQLDSQDDLLVIGALGRAKIHVAPQSVVQRVSRFLSQTFRIEK